MKEDGTMSKRGAMMSHFSKYVRPGYVRVDATKNPNTNVYISAYKGDNKVVIVAINKGTATVSQRFVLQSGSVSGLSTWVTDSSRNLAAGTVNASGSSFTAQLPAQSVTTFVGNLGASVKKGDLNSDVSKDALDLTVLRKHLLGIELLTNEALADLDANGGVDALDLSLLRQYLLGIIPGFPGESGI